MLGWSQETEPESRVVSVCFLCLVSGVIKCVHTFHEWNLGFLQLCCQSHWFSNQLRGLGLPVLDPRAGVHNIWFTPLTLQGGSLSLCNPLFFSVPSQWLRSQTYRFSSLSIRLCVDFSYGIGCMSLSASLQFVFSEDCSTCIFAPGVFLMCSWGKLP